MESEEGEANPHQAIIARHAARKQAREQAEKEEKEKALRLERELLLLNSGKEGETAGENGTNGTNGTKEDGAGEDCSGEKSGREVNGMNPHQAIIARHAARKLTREQEEKEGLQKAEKLDAKVKKMENLKLVESEAQRRLSELLAEKPKEPLGGNVQRNEGALKGWKERYFYLEDKLPLMLKCYKQYRAESEFLDGYELTADTIVEDEPGESNKPKGYAFLLKLNHKDTLRLVVVESLEKKLEWIHFIEELLTKHHGLARTLLPQEESDFIIPIKHRQSTSSSSVKFPESGEKRKSSFQVTPEVVLNPLLDDEILEIVQSDEWRGWRRN